MDAELPKAIADYFDADAAGDAGAVARCFTETAVVKDEARAHIGTDAIRQWKAEASTRYSYSVDPVAVTTEADRTIVTGRVSGDFPGSPTILRYGFVLSGDGITELEISA